MRCLTLNECQQWRKDYCRRDEWKRKTTCVTPLKRLPWYTTVLVGQLQPFDHALLIIDQVVFKAPPKLEKLRRLAGEQRPVHEAPGHAFENDSEGFRATLAAALSGWTTCALYSRPPSMRFGPIMTSTQRSLPGPQGRLWKFVACSAKAV